MRNQLIREKLSELSIHLMESLNIYRWSRPHEGRDTEISPVVQILQNLLELTDGTVNHKFNLKVLRIMEVLYSLWRAKQLSNASLCTLMLLVLPHNKYFGTGSEMNLQPYQALKTMSEIPSECGDNWVSRFYCVTRHVMHTIYLSDKIKTFLKLD